jgi:hypothetical protein
MLKFLPPPPFDVDLSGEQPISTKDEEGALLALQQHHRVRLIGLSEQALQKLVAVIDTPFPTAGEPSLQKARKTKTKTTRQPDRHNPLDGFIQAG